MSALARITNLNTADLRRAGITLSTIEVRFEALDIETDAYIGSRALPTIPNAFIDYVQACVL